MAGPELFMLLGPVLVWVGKVPFDDIPTVAMYDIIGGRLQPPRQIEAMLQQWPAGQSLQQFRQIRMHAFALARGQDDDG
jgi:hypothetical protein